MSNTLVSTAERRAQILRELSKRVEIKVTELSVLFDISEVTIRKDLTELANRNLLTRIRGGAMRLPNIDIEAEADEIGIRSKALFNYKEKKAIGKLAATLINDNETILLDSGSTTLEIAKNLDQFSNLTIITNAVNIAVELARYKRFSVILLGGHIRSSSLSTVGPVAESTLKIFYCDKLFLGVDSFSMSRGLSTTNIEEANINQTMISMAKEIIAVLDSSKFNKRSFAYIAPISAIETIVTDTNISTELKAQLKAMNVELKLADPNSI